MSYLYAPFILQGILMGVDESFHIKRGLGRWERLGHPLDTLSVLIPLSLISYLPYNEDHLNIFIGLAVFSCLFITKDEFVHARECPPMEHWLHALLFIIHPLIFLSAAIIWRDNPEHFPLMVQTFFVGCFFIYQILRWSIRWK
jgi:hypothetical protein